MSTKKALILIKEVPEEGQLYLVKKIAGLPLVLRLILSARKAGIEYFLIIGIHPDMELKVKKVLAKDRRLNASIEYGKNLLPLQERGEQNFLLMPSDSLPDSRLLKTLLRYPIEGEEVVEAGGCFLCTPSFYPLLEGSVDGMETRLYRAIRELAQQGRVKMMETGEFFSVTLKNEESLQYAEKMLFRTMGKSPFPEGFLQKLVNKRLSLLLTKRIISTSITPNLLTIISIFMGLLAACLFAYSAYYWASILGATIFQFCIIVDDSDGHIARLKFQESRFGVLLDRCGDLVVDTSIFVGIALGSYRKTSHSYFLWLGFLMTLGIFLTFLPTFWEELMGKEVQAFCPIEKRIWNQKAIIAEFTDRDWSYFVMLFALLDKLEWFLWMAALGATLFGLIILFSRIKTLKMIKDDKG